MGTSLHALRPSVVINIRRLVLLQEQNCVPAPSSSEEFIYSGAGAIASSIDAKVESLAEYVAQIQPNQDSDTITRGITALRKLLSLERYPPIQEVIDIGVVPRMVELMRDSPVTLIQFEASWALTNIASGSSDQTQAVMQAGALPVFITLLAHPNRDLSEQAAWALGNIAGDSARLRDECLQAGVVPPLLRICERQTIRVTMLRNATLTISNLCRGKPPPDFEPLRPALPILARLLQCDDHESLGYVVWSLSFLADDNSSTNFRIRAVAETGVVPQLVQLLTNPALDIMTPALRTVGNIVAGDDTHTRMVLDAGAMPKFVRLLTHRKAGIRKETCWVLSNTTDYLQLMIDEQVFPPIMQILKRDVPDVCRQAIWVLANAANAAHPTQMAYLIAQGIIPEFLRYFGPEAPASDEEIQQVAMEGMNSILACGERQAATDPKGLNPYVELFVQASARERLRFALGSANPAVRSLAASALLQYFGNAQPTAFPDPKSDPKDPKASDLQA